MYEKEKRGLLAVNDDSDRLIQALRDMPAPEPRPGFVDRALANATDNGRAAAGSRSGGLRKFVGRRETWLGAAIGAVSAAAVALLLLRPIHQTSPDESGITLALNEARNVDVLIESERTLEDATIHITVSGGVVLDGFENEREIEWQTNLEQGGNLLSLPVVARSAGSGRLIAVVEHDGKTRRVAVNLKVNGADVS